MPWKTGRPHDSNKPIGRHVDVYKTDATGKRSKDFKHHQDIKISYNEDKPFVHDIKPSGERVRESRFMLPQQVQNLKPTDQGREEYSTYMQLVHRYDATLDDLHQLDAKGPDAHEKIRAARSVAVAILQTGKQIAQRYPAIFLRVGQGNVPVAEFAKACEQAYQARIKELSAINHEGPVSSWSRPSIKELRKNWVDFIIRNDVGSIKDE